jgi:hypothetical protein
MSILQATAFCRIVREVNEAGMKCYECIKMGTYADAVALCTICGMGLCMEHAIRENLPVVDIID